MKELAEHPTARETIMGVSYDFYPYVQPVSYCHIDTRHEVTEEGILKKVRYERKTRS